MSSKNVSDGVVHTVPSDMKDVLVADPKLLEAWNGLTEIARNEWICWTTIVKKPETRKAHIERMEEELLSRKKRPCCWPGCPHRNEKAKKYFK